MSTGTLDKPADKTEQKLTGFTNGLAWKKVQFRGILYHVTELPIGEYDEIVTKATRKVAREDGPEDEVLDNQLQSRMMLKECVTEPARLDITKLGTRLTIALNRVVNELHYGEETDELVAPPKAESDDSDEEGKRPNA